MPDPAAVVVRRAESPADLDAVRALCRRFRAWLYDRYAAERGLIDLYYNPDDFETLLADLPRLHAPPDGAILIAEIGGAPAGCVMLRRFADGVCEMKRLYVGDEWRGWGVGAALCEALFGIAAAAGYRAMRLDTGPDHHEAKALYARLGFVERDAYHDPGPAWRGKLVYMERPLV